MNLTAATEVFKKGLKLLAAFAVVYYLFILVILPNARKLGKVLFPPKNPPNPSFGLLEPLEFVEKPINTRTPKFTLETVSGKLPDDIPDRMTVYKTKPASFSFLTDSDADRDAKFLGFTDEDLASDLKGDIFIWRKLATGSRLEINTTTRALSLATDIPKNSYAYPRGTLTDEEVMLNAKNLFKGLWRYNDPLYPAGEIRIVYGKVEGSKLVKTTDSRERQVARVDLFRSIKGYPILGEDPTKGLLHAIIKTPSPQKTPLSYPVVEANYWELDLNSDAVYPILTVEEAWKAVADNKGIITHVKEEDYNPFETYRALRVENVLIEEIYLAYYETSKRQPVIQPIFVFSGKYTTRGSSDGEITVYYPAVQAEFVKQPEPEQQP